MFYYKCKLCKNIGLTAVTGKSEGKKEISAIIVPTDVAGFTVIDNYEKMGLHASNTTELILEDVSVQKKITWEKRRRI